MEPSTAYAALTAVFAAGAAWGGVKFALNGTRARVDEIHNETKGVRKMLADHIQEESGADMYTHERLAKVETKVDILSDHVLKK